MNVVSMLCDCRVAALSMRCLVAGYLDALPCSLHLHLVCSGPILDLALDCWAWKGRGEKTEILVTIICMVDLIVYVGTRETERDRQREIERGRGKGLSSQCHHTRVCVSYPPDR